MQPDPTPRWPVAIVPAPTRSPTEARSRAPPQHPATLVRDQSCPGAVQRARHIAGATVLIRAPHGSWTRRAPLHPSVPHKMPQSPCLCGPEPPSRCGSRPKGQWRRARSMSSAPHAEPTTAVADPVTAARAPTKLMSRFASHPRPARHNQDPGYRYWPRSRPRSDQQ